MTDTDTRDNRPDLTEVIGDAILDYYGGYGQHPGVTRAYGAAEAAVAALTQEWTWRHNRYVGVEQAVRDGVIGDRATAERSAAVCRRANPGDDVGVVTRSATPWVEVQQGGGVTDE